MDKDNKTLNNILATLELLDLSDLTYLFEYLVEEMNKRKEKAK